MKKDNGKATAPTVASKVAHIPYMNILPRTFQEINNYFGIETTADKIMFHGFYGFCSIVALASTAIVHL